jgi:hypothetical protein
MSWKKKLNVDHFIISPEVDEYLKKHEFYESTMNPRFFGEETYSSDIISDGARCLRLDTEDPKNREYTMRIFITHEEVYMEVQNSWRSFDRSYHKKLDESVTLSNVDGILDEISDR